LSLEERAHPTAAVEWLDDKVVEAGSGVALALAA